MEKKEVARTLVSLCHFYLTRHTKPGIGVSAELFLFPQRAEDTRPEPNRPENQWRFPLSR
jgi:hypothetical protein